jgi:hypothetical protein
MANAAELLFTVLLNGLGTAEYRLFSFKAPATALTVLSAALIWVKAGESFLSAAQAALSVA